jgi:DNA-binding MarR family transcriptional regulator
VLTPSGEAIFADLQARRAAIAQDCLGNVSLDERKILSEILIKMLDGLDGGQNC